MKITAKFTVEHESPIHTETEFVFTAFVEYVYNEDEKPTGQFSLHIEKMVCRQSIYSRICIFSSPWSEINNYHDEIFQQHAMEAAIQAIYECKNMPDIQAVQFPELPSMKIAIFEPTQA